MEILRSYWEIPSICHFCSVFKAAFHLFDFDIQELEEGLLANCDQESSSLVPSLIKQLLQGCTDEDVTLDNWETCLWEILQERWVEENGRVHPFPSRSSSFNALPLHTKVEVLHTLCMYRLDSEDISDVLKGIDSNKLRIDPVGKDSQGSIYWYFSGLRLYKEERSRNSKWKKGDEGKLPWSLVCTTESDWHNLAKSLGKSRGTADRALHKVITNEFLPRLQEIVSEQERLARKRLLGSAPRRCSSRIEFKQKQKAREEELAALFAAEEERKRKEDEEKQRIEEEKERKEREIKERARRAEERLKAIEERANRARSREIKGQLQNESKTNSYNSEEETSSINSEQEMYPKKRSSISLQNSFSHILITNGSSKRQKAESYGYSSGEESTDDSIPNGAYTGNCVTPTWSYVNDTEKHPSSPVTRSSSGIFVSQFYSRTFMNNQSSKHEIKNGMNMGMLAEIVNQNDEKSLLANTLPVDTKWNRKSSDVKVS